LPSCSKGIAYPVNEIGEVSAVKSSEWQKLTDFFPKLLPNADKQELLGFLWHYQPIAQHWTWSAKLRLWESTLNRAIKMSKVWQGVSYQWYSLQQMVKIIGFVLQNSRAAASRKYGVLPSGPWTNVRPNIQLLVLVTVTVLFKTTDCG